jgi:hypothetical protein
MSAKWVKCGLPWTYYEDTDYPAAPKLDKEIKAEFGKTPTEYYTYLCKTYGFETNKEYVKESKAYRRFCEKVRAWVKEQPATKKHQKELEAYNAELAKKSFCGRKLNQPGTLIEVKIDGELKQLLIGDINTLGGVCDDCMDFGRDVIVVRYKVLGGRGETGSRDNGIVEVGVRFPSAPLEKGKSKRLVDLLPSKKRAAWKAKVKSFKEREDEI